MIFLLPRNNHRNVLPERLLTRACDPGDAGMWFAAEWAYPHRRRRARSFVSTSLSRFLPQGSSYPSALSRLRFHTVYE
jgi:hypothetical protein